MTWDGSEVCLRILNLLLEKSHVDAVNQKKISINEPMNLYER
jgi:hypothetical protein